MKQKKLDYHLDFNLWKYGDVLEPNPFVEPPEPPVKYPAVVVWTISLEGGYEHLRYTYVYSV